MPIDDAHRASHWQGKTERHFAGVLKEREIERVVVTHCRSFKENNFLSRAAIYWCKARAFFCTIVFCALALLKGRTGPSLHYCKASLPFLDFGAVFVFRILGDRLVEVVVFSWALLLLLRAGED
jgi:hypothetical protein